MGLVLGRADVGRAGGLVVLMCAGMVGCADELRYRSGGAPVLVDDPAKDIVAMDRARERGARGLGQPEPEPAVKAGFVVMAEVLGEDGLELAAGEDEQVVQALLAYSPHPALGVRVRPRCPHGRAQDPDTGRGQDGVEGRGELCVTVPREEGEVVARLLQGGQEVARHLGHPRAIGFGCHAQDVHHAGVQLDHEEHVVAL